MRSGTTIAQYRIAELLGQGGMGEVYRAVDTRLDRPVALKFLAGHLVSDPEAKERFNRRRPLRRWATPTSARLTTSGRRPMPPFRALELLRGVRYHVPSAAASHAITVATHARFLRAEMEMGRGDPEAARYLYEGIVNAFTPPDKIFLASACERLGQLHEAAGRRDEAIYYTDKLVRVCGEVDPELTDRLEAAKTRLAALRDA